MIKDTTEITIKILGKSYQIKCPEDEASALQEAAFYLEKKMRETRDTSKVLSIDRIAVITALNMAHQLLELETQAIEKAHAIQQRLRDIQNKVDTALVRHAQLELTSAE
ncbi:MAG: cell division protein ZapA [Gammaproteobacteria bacterium]